MRMLMLSLAALLGLARPIALESLPAPETAAPAELPATARAQLQALVTETSHGRYTVNGARWFDVRDGIPWIAIVKRIDGEAARKGAKRVDLPGADPGLKLVEAWEGANGRGVAVAMIRRGGNGAGSLAFFSIARKTG